MAVSVPPEAAGKLPPQNEEAEVSVLGAILLSEQALDGLLIDVKLKPEDFYRERHRLIFRSMIRLKEKTSPEPVDALTVCEDLARAGDLEEAGGTAYVHSLPNLVPSSSMNAATQIGHAHSALGAGGSALRRFSLWLIVVTRSIRA